MADKQPPLPKGAVFSDSGIPPLPPGATFISSDPSIPTMSADFESRPIAKKDTNKLVEAISAGKAKDFEQFFYGGEKPSETTLGNDLNLRNRTFGSSNIPITNENLQVKTLSPSSISVTFSWCDMLWIVIGILIGVVIVLLMILYYPDCFKDLSDNKRKNIIERKKAKTIFT